MLSTIIDLVEHGELNLGKLEQLAWTALMKEFQHLVVELLEGLDKYLSSRRDVSRYDLKDPRQRTLQTLVGEVTFRRR